MAVQSYCSSPPSLGRHLLREVASCIVPCRLREADRLSINDVDQLELDKILFGNGD